MCGTPLLNLLLRVRILTCKQTWLRFGCQLKVPALSQSDVLCLPLSRSLRQLRRQKRSSIDAVAKTGPQNVLCSFFSTATSFDASLSLVDQGQFASMFFDDMCLVQPPCSPLCAWCAVGDAIAMTVTLTLGSLQAFMLLRGCTP